MTLTPERWQRARDVLHEAMQMDEGERSAFLDSQCASDPSMRVELKELLAAEGEIGPSFLEEHALAHAVSRTDTNNRTSVLPPGTKLGPYVVQSLIGAGGMGEVYRARDTRLNRVVALKILPASSSSDELRRQRLHREARAISALQHPHICTLHDVGQQNGIDFLVMELLDGETLALRLEKSKLSLDHVLTYGIEIADALDAAQRRGIIHRDLKPGNIFLTSHGECKVLDFGLAKLDEDSPDAPTVAQPDVLTSPGVAIGTVAYMSPEQARGEPLDSRTDIFSLGAVLYEMATGKSPFMGRTSAVTFKAILDSTPPPPSQVNNAIPPKLDEVVGKCLEKERDLRYQSAAELRTDLKRIKRDSDSQRIAAAGEGTPRANRRALLIAIATLAALLVLGGISIVVYRRISTLHSLHIDAQGMKMTRLTELGKVSNAAISPDGRYIAYSLQQAPYGIWVRQVSSESTVQVVSGANEAIRRITFSADSSNLYYVRGSQGYVVSLLGGTPRLVIGKTMGGIAVSPNGEYLAYHLGGGGAVTSQLFVIASKGTGKHLVAEHPVSSGINFLNGAPPSWSPDGKHIAMVASGNGGTFFLNIYPTEGGVPTTLPVPPWSVQGPWLPNEGALLLMISRTLNGPSQIWAQSVPQGSLQRLTNDLDGYYSLSVTKDGSTLAAVQVQDSYTVFIAPASTPDQGASIRSGKSDGTALVWLSDRKLFLQNLDSEFSLLTEDGKSKVSMFKDNVRPGRFSVCPDGHVVFAKDAQIWRTDPGGENLKQLATGKWEDDLEPDCSPNSRFVIFTIEAGLVRVPIDGGTPVVLSKDAGFGAHYSPDGREIADFERGENIVNLVIRDAQTGRIMKSLPMPEGYNLPWGSTGVLRWTPDGKTLTCLLWKGVNSSVNIWAQPVTGGSPRQLTHVPDEIIAYGWSPDGKQLAYTRSAPTRDVVLISNFH